MKVRVPSLTPNQKLALLAGLFGFLALFAGSPYTGNTATINVKELAVMVQRETDHVTVDELADWIIKGKADYRLIDLRSPNEFEEYHIPGAENSSIATLPDVGFLRNEKIVLYSEGGTHAAQAWFLLKALGYKNVYILKDGLAEWKDRILFPSLAENASTEENAAFEKRKEMSKYFGGSPQLGGTTASSAPQIVMPKLEMPSVPAAPSVATKKKKKEGC